MSKTNVPSTFPESYGGKAASASKKDHSPAITATTRFVCTTRPSKHPSPLGFVVDSRPAGCNHDRLTRPISVAERSWRVRILVSLSRPRIGTSSAAGYLGLILVLVLLGGAVRL